MANLEVKQLLLKITEITGKKYGSRYEVEMDKNLLSDHPELLEVINALLSIGHKADAKRNARDSHTPVQLRVHDQHKEADKRRKIGK